MKLDTKRTVLVGFAFLSICAFWQMYDNLVPKILHGRPAAPGNLQKLESAVGGKPSPCQNGKNPPQTHLFFVLFAD